MSLTQETFAQARVCFACLGLTRTDVQLAPLKGKPVSLVQGKTGYFLDAVYRANCSDATLTWEQDRSRFAIAIKAGKLETLIKMADSAAIAICP